MLSRFPRTLGFALGALVLGIIIVAGVTLARRTLPQRTLPQVSGVIRVPGLRSQVTVARDRWGVPHIYAADEHDLFVAQGYVTAQDRLWQMLLRRQAARGRLSDWLGARAAQADDVLSHQNFPAQAASVKPDPRDEAYALGVNVCIQTCPAAPELAFLKRQGKVSQVEPWTAADSVALLRMMWWAQRQRGSAGLREELSTHLGSARASNLWSEEMSLTVSSPPVTPAVRLALRLTGIPLQSGGDTSPAILDVPPGLPAAWYLVTLHSERYTVTGATWPGLPEVRVQWLSVAPSAGPQRELLSHLLELPPTGWLQVRVHGMLSRWDYDLSGKTRLGNASAAVYAAWVWHLARDTFQDELGADLFARHWATGFAPQTLARLAEQPDNPWWDDGTTPQRETRDDILRRAYAEALNDLGRHYGDLHTIWEWDILHAAEFQHPLGGALPLSWLLDRTVKLGGAAPFDPAHPNDPVNPYAAALVSPLVIGRHRNGGIEFALAGGQSGNPFSPHYADLLTLWARSELAPLQDAARPQDLRDVESVLVLVP